MNHGQRSSVPEMPKTWSEERRSGFRDGWVAARFAEELVGHDAFYKILAQYRRDSARSLGGAEQGAADQEVLAKLRAELQAEQWGHANTRQHLQWAEESAALASSPSQPWTSVKERPPPEGEEVLGYWDDEDMHMPAWRSDGDEWWHAPVEFGCEERYPERIHAPSHWMPLPAAPALGEGER